MLRHVRKFHSQEAIRKAEANDELTKLEVLHSNKVPRLDVEEQVGGAVSTRGTKRPAEESNSDIKELKPEVKP